MEFIQITSPDDFRAKEIYSSYINSFPEDERRNREQFSRLFTNEKVKVFSVLNDLKYIGYLIAWELTEFVFVEHFEIFSEFRSQKFGSEVIKKLFHDYSKIILEAEPSDWDDDARRRIDFYKRNGFRIVDENYLQPPYSQHKKPVPLWLLANYTPEKLGHMREEIYDVVYCLS